MSIRHTSRDARPLRISYRPLAGIGSGSIRHRRLAPRPVAGPTSGRWTRVESRVSALPSCVRRDLLDDGYRWCCGEYRPRRHRPSWPERDVGNHRAKTGYRPHYHVCVVRARACPSPSLGGAHECEASPGRGQRRASGPASVYPLLLRDGGQRVRRRNRQQFRQKNGRHHVTWSLLHRVSRPIDDAASVSSRLRTVKLPQQRSSPVTQKGASPRRSVLAETEALMNPTPPLISTDQSGHFAKVREHLVGSPMPREVSFGSSGGAATKSRMTRAHTRARLQSACRGQAASDRLLANTKPRHDSPSFHVRGTKREPPHDVKRRETYSDPI